MQAILFAVLHSLAEAVIVLELLQHKLVLFVEPLPLVELDQLDPAPLDRLLQPLISLHPTQCHLLWILGPNPLLVVHLLLLAAV
mmetsp:Transcript_26488/g.25616  ORF Transcript_26488/g.25616 Transcript_26488/m.25616 type:complete len:84 (-) Transcript_26488:315-566(-)